MSYNIRVGKAQRRCIYCFFFTSKLLFFAIKCYNSDATKHQRFMMFSTKLKLKESIYLRYELHRVANIYKINFVRVV